MPDPAVARRGFTNRLLFFVTTWWVVLYSNSRMDPELPNYAVSCLFRVPRAVRVLEVAIILVVFAGALGADNFQDLYLRVLPFVGYVIFGAHGVDRDDVRAMLRFYVIATLVSVAMALGYQIPFHGDNEDFITGFYSDAHLFGALVAIVSVGFLSEFVETRRLRFLGAAGALFLFSFFPKNEKVVLFNGAWFGLIFVTEWLIKQRAAVKIAFVVAFAAMVALGYQQIDQFFVEKSGLRFEAFLNYGASNAGPIRAWPIALEQLAGSTVRWLFGLGAGEFGWIASFRAVSGGGGSQAAQIFSFEFSFDNPNSSGFLFRTNTWSSLLAEFGVLGFVVFLAALAVIASHMLRARCVDRFERTLVRVFFFTLGCIVFQGLFTPFTNWGEATLMLPMMYIAAFFASRDGAKA
jgi:hypothetical protein